MGLVIGKIGEIVIEIKVKITDEIGDNRRNIYKLNL